MGQLLRGRLHTWRSWPATSGANSPLLTTRSASSRTSGRFGRVCRVASRFQQVLLGLCQPRPVVFRGFDFGFQGAEFVFAFCRSALSRRAASVLTRFLLGLRLLPARLRNRLGWRRLWRRAAANCRHRTAPAGLASVSILRVQSRPAIPAPRYCSRRRGELLLQGFQRLALRPDLLFAPVGGGDARGKRVALGAEDVEVFDTGRRLLVVRRRPAPSAAGLRFPPPSVPCRRPPAAAAPGRTAPSPFSSSADARPRRRQLFVVAADLVLPGQQGIRLVRLGLMPGKFFVEVAHFGVQARRSAP